MSMSAPSAWTARVMQERMLRAVQQHGAGPADAVLAADVGTGQAEVLAEEVDEQAARLDLRRTCGWPLTVRLIVRVSGAIGSHLSFRARATASSIPRRR